MTEFSVIHPFFVAVHDTRLDLDLDFQIRQLDGPRRIIRTGERAPVKEVLAIRNDV